MAHPHNVGRWLLGTGLAILLVLNVATWLIPADALASQEAKKYCFCMSTNGEGCTLTDPHDNCLACRTEEPC